MFASSQRLKLETPAFKIGGQIYVFNSADDAKLPCFVSLRWFPGSMGFQNGAGMKTEKPLGTKLPFKSTRSKSRTLSWWVMKLSFGMILFFQDRGRLVGVTIFISYLQSRPSSATKRSSSASSNGGRKFSGSFPRSSSMEKPPSGKTKNIAQGLLSKEEQYMSV